MQMKQRAIMATAMRGYSALKEICDHSFEGVTYGQKSMNYFIAENARMIRSAAPKVNLSLSKGNSVSNAYIISKGSLPTIVVVPDPSGKIFKINMGLSATFSFGDVMAALGATTIGDMVTFVNLVDNPEGNASTYWFRLKLTEANKSKSFTASENPNIVESLTEGTDFDTNIDNFTAEDFSISYITEGGSTYLRTLSSEKDAQSMGVILSRKSDAGWLRSPSTMVNLTSTFNYDKAIASYPESDGKILNGGNS